MKRKLLNAALFGAVLVAAPVSTFVSCADYEADITTLEQTIDDLKGVVDQKEAVIKQQVAALEAQDKAFADKIADLEKAQKDCKDKCAADLAQCKADCAAARAALQSAIDDLKAGLAAAEKKHADDVASLIAKDGELDKAIAAAQADIEVLKGKVTTLEGDVATLTEGLTNTQNDVQQLVEGLKGLQTQVNTLETEVGKVDGKLADLKKELQGEIDKVRDLVNNTKTELKAQIDGNTTLIKALEEVVKGNKAEFDNWKATDYANDIQSLKNADAALGQRIDGVIVRVEKLESDNEANKKDIKKLQEDLAAVQADVAKLDSQVAKNTKAIVDLAARMVDAELAIADAVEKLGLLEAQFETFKVAQAEVDAAQDLLIQQAISGYLAAQAAAEAAQGTANTALQQIAAVVAPEGEYGFGNINKAYKAALEEAQKAAQAAQAAAEAYAKKYADDNFYNKAKVDEFVAALEAADAQRDADFQAWQEQVLLPLFADVWGELLDEDGNSRLSVLEEGLSTTQADVMHLSDGLIELTTQVNANTADIAANKAKIEDVEAAYKAADAKIEADFKLWCETVLVPEFENVYNEIEALNTNIGKLSKEVKGFVLEPASYYEGIQAIEGTSYEYHKWNVTDELNPVQDGDFVQYCPSVTAHYHINPSKAILSEDVANYSFAVLDRDNRAGVNTALKPVVTKAKQNGGMLDVTLCLTDASANKTPQDHQDPSEVTVMALQYTNPAAIQENQVVTSDYAVLYLNPLREVSLVSATNSDHEITDVFAQVVPNNDQDWVEYTQSYDIQEHIAAKFGGENSVSMTELPEGFTVKYTPVYGDVTYFTPITADGKITPQLPNGNPATTACVGKNATWRIDIMHGDDVVEVGFYKVTIVGEAVIETAPAIVTDSILKVTCEPTDEALNTNLSIENVWNKIAEVTGEELDVVKGKYSVSLTDSENKTVAQFREYETVEDRVLYKQYEGKGVVKLNADGTVNWTVLDNDPAVETDLRSATKDMKSMVTYIRVRSNDAINRDTYNEFYMPLIWTPKPIEFWGESQELSWTYTRVANQWQDNKGTREEAELRLYADLTKTGTTPFTYNIPEKAMVNFDFSALKFVGTAAKFVNVENGNITLTDGHFRFIDHPNDLAKKYLVDGKTYVLSVNAEGTNLYANDSVVIATITPEGVVSLVNNPTTQTLLNAFEKDELLYGQTLCARVGFAAKCCAGTVEVIDGDFDVRFIKPLTVNTEDINISDADDITNAGKITTSILNNIVCFNNYTLAERPNYIEVFGVGIKLGNVADWKTNYNAAEDDFTKTLGENHIAELFGKNEAKGEITYTNNTAVVSEFSVLIPVKVHYNWYTEPIEATIKLNVGRTQGNSHRR